MSRRVFIITVGLVWVAATLIHAVPADAGEPMRAERHMIAAANPLAARAGLEILRQGGSAVDVNNKYTKSTMETPSVLNVATMSMFKSFAIFFTI